jgi:hypothetical protein
MVYTNIEDLSDIEKYVIGNITEEIDGNMKRNVVQRFISKPNRIKVLYTIESGDYVLDITDRVISDVKRIERDIKLKELLK